jgi:hypothetical protein
MKTRMKIIQNLLTTSLALSIVLFFVCACAFVFYWDIFIYVYLFLSMLCLLYICWFIIRNIKKFLNSLTANYQAFATATSDGIKYDC